MSWPRLVPHALLALIAAGCTAVGPDFHASAPPLQSAWSDPGLPASASSLSDDQWWAQFEDATLTRLIAQAREANPGVRSAAVRVAQAHAQWGVTDAAAWPLVQISVGASHAKPDQKSQLQGKRDGSTTVQLANQASWEPDFWGQAARAGESARADWMGSIAAHRAALVSLDASVAGSYFSLCTLDQRIAVAQGNLAQQAENLRIAQARYRAGATSELDWRQAQAQYEQTQAQLPTLSAAREQAAHAIAFLLGQPPQAQQGLQCASPGPRVPMALPLGAPADLLRRRPDVVQAEWVVAAQSARIGQAKAALYPSFSLSGSIGFQASDAGGNSLGDLFQWRNKVESLAAGLVLPIFDHGRLKNQVRVQEAQFDQALIAYENQVLKAQQEVEDALRGIAHGEHSRQALQRATEAARRGAQLALQRYKAGESDYTPVITADQARLSVEDAQAQAEGNQLQFIVAAYRALGGAWTDTPTRP